MRALLSAYRIFERFDLFSFLPCEDPQIFVRTFRDDSRHLVVR